MSTTWDWSPVFGPQGAIQQYLQNMQFQKQLGGMMGQENLPGAPAMNASVNIPGQATMPGFGGGQFGVGSGGVPAQVPGNQVTARMPGGYHPQIGGGNIQVGGYPIDASTSAIAPQTTFNGPVGQALGDERSAALMPFLQAMGPRSLPMLLQTTQDALQHKQDIADKRITPMSGQEAQAMGLRAGGVYGRDPAGNPVTIQASDMESPGAVKQKEGVYADENVFTPIPITDPAYAGMKPGTILGRNKLGAVKPLQESDMKSKGAMDQEMQLVKAKEYADIAKQNAMYGVGPGGAQSDFAKPLPNNAYEAVAQSVANYDRGEATALSRYPAPIRAQIQARVSAINPNYSQTDYNAANGTKLAFAKGPQGQSVQSLNSTISHMDLMKQYVAALNNGDQQTVNALKNAIATEFGGVAPTNAQAVAEILGPEMAKAVLPNGGTGPEREGFINTLKQKASQGQLLGTLDTYQGLMAGQLLSLKKRYANIPGHPQDFENKFLLPETQHILSSRPEYHGGVVDGPPGGGGANIAPTGTKATGPNGKVLTSDGKGGWH
jgi:hypothetical protein